MEARRRPQHGMKARHGSARPGRIRPGGGKKREGLGRAGWRWWLHCVFLPFKPSHMLPSLWFTLRAAMSLFERGEGDTSWLSSVVRFGGLALAAGVGEERGPDMSVLGWCPGSMNTDARSAERGARSSPQQLYCSGVRHGGIDIGARCAAPPGTPGVQQGGPRS